MHVNRRIKIQRNDPLLEARALSCERDDRWLFKDLTFNAQAGEIWRILGPNGTGKTTLLRILSGLSSSFNGSIYFQQKPVQRNRQAFHAQLLYLGHQPGVKANLTAIENLRWLCGMHESVSVDVINSALNSVGLKGFEDIPCHSLSAGQQRRVALARLFITKCPIWILDEPFTAIDKKGVSALESLLVDHAKKGGLVILTTHHDLNIVDEAQKIYRQIDLEVIL
jgi:heme exporter protein A